MNKEDQVRLICAVIADDFPIPDGYELAFLGNRSGVQRFLGDKYAKKSQVNNLDERTLGVSSRLNQLIGEFEMLLRLLNVDRVVEKERTGDTSDPICEHVKLKKKGE
jgi:hypothetical protein